MHDKMSGSKHEIMEDMPTLGELQEKFCNEQPKRKQNLQAVHRSFHLFTYAAFRRIIKEPKPRRANTGDDSVYEWEEMSLFDLAKDDENKDYRDPKNFDFCFYYIGRAP